MGRVIGELLAAAIFALLLTGLGGALFVLAEFIIWAVGAKIFWGVFAALFCGLFLAIRSNHE